MGWDEAQNTLTGMNFPKMMEFTEVDPALAVGGLGFTHQRLHPPIHPWRRRFAPGHHQHPFDGSNASSCQQSRGLQPHNDSGIVEEATQGFRA